MESEILEKEYVLEHGINIENLIYNPVLDIEYRNPNEEKEGYTGLVYEVTEDGCLLNYAYYADGCPNGDCVAFYPDGQVKSYTAKSGGMLNGVSEEWDEEGNRTLLAEYKWGIVMKRNRWASDGLQIEEYEAPASHVKMAEKLEAKYKGK